MRKMERDTEVENRVLRVITITMCVYDVTPCVFSPSTSAAPLTPTLQWRRTQPQCCCRARQNGIPPFLSQSIWYVISPDAV